MQVSGNSRNLKRLDIIIITNGARDSDSWFPAAVVIVEASGPGAYTSRSYVPCSPVTLFWHFEHLMICPQRAAPALVKEPTSRHYGIGHSRCGRTFGHSFSNKSICAFPAFVITLTKSFLVATHSLLACSCTFSVQDSSSSSIAVKPPVLSAPDLSLTLPSMDSAHCSSRSCVRTHSLRLNRRSCQYRYRHLDEMVYFFLAVDFLVAKCDL